MTPAGRELLDDASSVVDDTMKATLKRAPEPAARVEEITELLNAFDRCS